MKKLSIRGLRLALLTVGLAGLFVMLNAVPGAATDPTLGFSSTPLARGINVSDGTIPLKEGTDNAVATNTFPVHGASSGWHSHPGGAIVVVQQGEITFYRSVGNHCDATKYTAGQSFIERPDDVANAVNTGTGPTITYALFPSVPHLGMTRIDQPNPGTCPPGVV